MLFTLRIHTLNSRKSGRLQRTERRFAESLPFRSDPSTLFTAEEQNFIYYLFYIAFVFSYCQLILFPLIIQTFDILVCIFTNTPLQTGKFGFVIFVKYVWTQYQHVFTHRFVLKTLLIKYPTLILNILQVWCDAKYCDDRGSCCWLVQLLLTS